MKDKRKEGKGRERIRRKGEEKGRRKGREREDNER